MASLSELSNSRAAGDLLQRRKSTTGHGIILLLLSLVVSTCSDQEMLIAPVESEEPDSTVSPTEHAAAGPAFPVQCSVSVGSEEMSCAIPEEVGGPSGPQRVILGDQNTHVRLSSSNVSYDGSSVFQADVTVQNLIGQAIGTDDGTTVHMEGVRVFFHDGPTVTDSMPEGSVSVANPSGTGTFTATNQPYFQYDETLDTDSISSAMTWQFDVPPTVNTFEFWVFVTAAVQYPDGWVEVTPSDTGIQVGETVLLNPVVRDQFGEEVSGVSVDWQNDNEAVVSFDPANGEATGLAVGTAQITAIPAGPQVSATVNVIVYTCHPALADPVFAVRGVEDELPPGGVPSTRYLLTFVNGSEFPAEIFESAPDLPLCGVNPASRTWMETYSSDGVRNHGFCMALSADDYESTWMYYPQSDAPVSGYVTLHDRRCDLTYTSPLFALPLNLSVGQSINTPLPHSAGQILRAEAGAYRVALMPREEGNGPAALPNGLQLRAIATVLAQQFLTPFPLQRLAVRGPLQEEEALDPELQALARATEELHYRLREEEIRRARETPTPAGAWLGPPSVQLALEQADYEPPTTRTFWIRDPADPPNRVLVNATLRDYNDYIEYYEDDGVNSDETRATDQEIADLIGYYQAYGHNLIADVFGGLGPTGTTNVFTGDLRPTDDLDQNGGRVIVLQTRASLMPAGAAAYVSSCDRYPHQDHAAFPGYYCTNSNEAEMTYFSHPGNGDGTSDASEWFYFGSLVHEVKHISSHGYAIYAGRGFNPSWLEEGTAEIAKEKSSRDASGIADGVEVRHSDIYPFTASSYGMYVVQSRARSYLRASPLSALFGNPNPNPNGSTYYGASWLFHRFLSDAYAGGDEDAFFRQLNTGGYGVAQVEAVTGQTLPDLLAEFVIAIGVEGYPTARAATVKRFTSNDFYDLAVPWTGTWPYVQASSDFESANWSFETHYSSPNFFDFTGSGDTGLRLDVLTMAGLDLNALDEVVMTITRIQ